MSDDLTTLIDRQPIYDVHEHHIPDVTLARDIDLLRLLTQSYADGTQERPYPLPGEVRAEDPMLERPQATSWEAVAPYLERSGSNAFVRNLVTALGELYDLGESGITQSNWRELDEAIRRRHADPSWPAEVLRRAGVRRVITDVYTDPLLDVREALGATHDSVLRINALALGWHPGSHDHNGNSGRGFAERCGQSVNTFDDYLDFLEYLVVTLGERHQLGLKNALAYDRDLDFSPPETSQARRAWNEPAPSASARKAFGDLIVDRLCALAAAHGVPVQMHLGSAWIRGSHPLRVAGLVERHPRTRFLLMHLAYPWSRDLLGMAFVYRNIWLDLTWSHLLSPSHFKLALHEAIEVLPDESRLMLGGDCWHVEETYGALRGLRRLVGEVLAEKVATGYFDEATACRLARRILHDNAAEFFAR